MGGPAKKGQSLVVMGLAKGVTTTCLVRWSPLLEVERHLVLSGSLQNTSVLRGRLELLPCG